MYVLLFETEEVIKMQTKPQKHTTESRTLMKSAQTCIGEKEEVQTLSWLAFKLEKQDFLLLAMHAKANKNLFQEQAAGQSCNQTS